MYLMLKIVYFQSHKLKIIQRHIPNIFVQRNKTWKYGNVMKINIPPKYWRQEGWSLILRFNGAHKNSGTFQVWNAQFFNIYRKPDGLEIHLQMKWWTADIDDQHSFTIVSDHLNLGDKRKIIFYRNLQNCKTDLGYPSEFPKKFLIYKENGHYKTPHTIFIF
jgi:hypothetical protein